VKVVIWLVEGTWQGCLAAAVRNLPPDSHVALLHVTPSDITEVAEAATAGLLGRVFARHVPGHHYEEAADQAASQILVAGAARLRREGVELLHRRGRVEREVVSAVAQGVDLLVIARDGDRSRLGPRSLGPATRFVVDHAPCSVLLVWPEEPPGIESIPPPPEGHRPPPGPHREGLPGMPQPPLP